MTYTTLIQPAELAAFLQSRATEILVCDCSFDFSDRSAGARAYASEHLPGAVYVSLEEDLSGTKTGLNGRNPLPDPNHFAAKIASTEHEENGDWPID
jgi:thiosulfate/3-mercaptopyruvate sulfurtransferase